MDQRASHFSLIMAASCFRAQREWTSPLRQNKRLSGRVTHNDVLGIGEVELEHFHAALHEVDLRGEGDHEAARA